MNADVPTLYSCWVSQQAPASEINSPCWAGQKGHSSAHAPVTRAAHHHSHREDAVSRSWDDEGPSR